ncbi:hypothetical protein HPB47_007756 [Ixodes persulcatus]|uniref:Uncharacterized protein n=1 Tax=Ixodes persulcatus TaxID=34615 RepID=A0AC60P6R2_IXOPE|nr:hypothetical protein HPB47_007756 [Ixodes persulcatus]
MYLHAVSSLSTEIADELEDILANPPATGSYGHLKAAVLAKKTSSDGSRLQHPLNTEELDDQRPSQLLRSSELSLLRLPSSMVIVHPETKNVPFDQLANLSDPTATIANLSRSSQELANPPPRIVTNTMETRLSRLEQAVQDILLSLHPQSMFRRRSSYRRWSLGTNSPSTGHSW